MTSEIVHLTGRSRKLDFHEAQSSESWERALRHGQNAEIDGEWGSLGAQTVTLPDSDDTHRTLLVKTPDETYVGACDCDGFVFYGSACAHLCTLRQLEGLGDYHIQTNGGYVDELLSTDPPDDSTDDRTATADEKMDTEDTAQPSENGSERFVEGTGGDVVDVPSESTGPERRRRDAFAEPLPDVDSQYVMDMGGETYIRRAGYARLGQQQGFRPVPEIVQYAHEGDEQRAVVLGKILNDEGEVIAKDIGTAGPPEYEDMDGAGANLDELATTRALTRAMAWATGEGLTAVEEIPGGPDGD